MKPKHLLLLLPAAAIAGVVFAQGPLTPTGAPAPVMKTLDQIEPRTPISSLPFGITAPGSYYLTANLEFTATSGDAIIIATSHVTVDLSGFALTSSAAVTGDAVRINGGLRSIAVKNGSITGNTTVSISGTPPNQSWSAFEAGFNNGIHLLEPTPASSCHFSDLRVSRCRDNGINGSAHAVVDRVTATQNGRSGIDLAEKGSVTNCTATANGFDGINSGGGSVTNCVASFNGGNSGIAGVTVTNSRADRNNSTGISGSSISNCTADSNGGGGISGSGAAIANSRAASNGGTGIGSFGGSITNCTAVGNESHGISGTGISVANCVANSNSANGISSPGGSVVNCTAASNGGDGINVSSGVVAFCRASGNNTNNDGSTDFDAAGSVRTGNNPAP